MSGEDDWKGAQLRHGRRCAGVPGSADGPARQLTDRIAEVLHEHYPLYCNERGGCDTGNYVGGWAKHAAEAVVAALQLTPETVRLAQSRSSRPFDGRAGCC